MLREMTFTQDCHYEESRVAALVLTFVKYIIKNCFDICFCIKSIIIKLLRIMVLLPWALCLSMDKWTLCGHFYSQMNSERSLYDN